MTTGGLSKLRLDRMHEVMAGHVEAGLAPGIVTLISRRGEVHVDVIGNLAIDNPAIGEPMSREPMSRDPMRRDTIFRITSMTKPVTAVAAMILVEECALRLDEPVDRLLPELADRKVLTRIDGPLDDTVPANRPITVRDLLTFRPGTGMVFGPAEEYPILRAIHDVELSGFGLPSPAAPHDPDEWMRRLGTLPLMYQPGERWQYNTGSCILGVLIARAAGQSFGDFLEERIFQPLGMKDTAFWVGPDKLNRFATSYMAGDPSKGLDLIDPPDGQWSQPPTFPDGAANLASTIDDYHAFGQMLLNQGRHGNERILSRPSVELMTTDQLTPAQKAVSGFVPGQWDNRGWGFGVCVVTGRDELAATPGRYGWDGGYGTSWWNDPAEEMVAILMTQRAQFPPLSPIYQDFWASTYQAIDD
jgi:CubicO group peptidase (beta-lactamase class C family)